MLYFDWILGRNSFLSGNRYSVADISLAAALSSLDYLHEIEWKNYEKVKNWYAVIKAGQHFVVFWKRVFTIFLHQVIIRI